VHAEITLCVYKSHLSVLYYTRVILKHTLRVKSHYAGENCILRVESTLVRVEITLERFEITVVRVVIADLFIFFHFLGGGEEITPLHPPPYPYLFLNNLFKKYRNEDKFGLYSSYYFPYKLTPFQIFIRSIKVVLQELSENKDLNHFFFQ
jgi:hypothetical protein